MYISELLLERMFRIDITELLAKRMLIRSKGKSDETYGQEFHPGRMKACNGGEMPLEVL